MKINRILFSLFLLTCSTALIAQCSNNHKKTSTAKQVAWTHHKDIVDVAASSEDFSTLVAAVKAADLVNTLKSDGPFTVFAPVNSAFAKLPKGTVSSLLQPNNKSKLVKILTYHVVAGKFNAADVIAAIKASDGEFTVKTVSGDLLKASIQNDTVILTDEKGGVAAITKTDVNASNGVIHIIDSVVIPN